ncbi:transposase family protein [Streptomyces fuscichromogenes]|uniref:transposase family protein n=1 Tax=Streptomyces fuscichromogenes TaxID=1324013 RepID=UPI003570B7AD
MFSSVEGVLVESVEVIDTVVRVEARTTVGRAVCPGCGCWSGRIHGSYVRFPRDLPTAGKSSWCRCGCGGSSVRRNPASA